MIPWQIYADYLEDKGFDTRLFRSAEPIVYVYMSRPTRESQPIRQHFVLEDGNGDGCGYIAFRRGDGTGSGYGSYVENLQEIYESRSDDVNVCMGGNGTGRGHYIEEEEEEKEWHGGFSGDGEGRGHDENYEDRGLREIFGQPPVENPG